MPHPWSCNLGNGWSGNDGVICRWNAGVSATPPFAGTPGERNCEGRSDAALANHFGNLRTAARLLGFSDEQALKMAVKAFCRG